MIEPTLWQRIDVPLTSTLLALHDIIQITVGWSDSHPFEFVVADRVYSEPLPRDGLLKRRVHSVQRIHLEQLLYVYDFGDDRHHVVTVEDVRAGARDIDYPAAVVGERRCPPEDVGGAPGFMGFLEARSLIRSMTMNP